MIRVQHLHASVKGFDLTDIDFEVRPGEYFVILGPNGAGKTMLLDSIAGFRKVRSGRILVDGKETTHLPPEKRRIGYMFQDSTLFPHLNVEENIMFGLKRHGASRQERHKACGDISGLFGISHLLKKKPATLSGGEAQRVSLARTLAVDPALLLLDEPLSAVDPAKREELQDELRKMHDHFKKTVIHVTHSFEEAVSLAGRIAVMNEGRIVQIGTADEVFRRPGSEFVARFSMARNVFKVNVEDADRGLALASASGTGILTTTRLRGSRYMSLRPEDIIVSKEPIVSSALNSLEGVIRRIENRGHVVYLTVDVPPELVSIITARSLQEMGLEEGERVFIAFKASAVWVF